ncbi:hypothetical protein ACRE_090540 [Hapsidospora chrysogenum ATCC 11550]|uniref:Uncharacterized protein n=1 Tax=Hapsidospora chrysogenum (strain ATCC 11550 / CBS 779.69 / DSM 880 / IAM 14645 / JCM 23072 / IMI 49137) TaxID=857340 RepID=A0A086ST54_HAPC1|nr:hypothetical protein ACRE_090540 [Hapsidospora chrysogenum ATCC 11550]
MLQPQNNPEDVQRGPGGIHVPPPPPHMQQAQKMNQDGQLSVPAKQGKLHVETSGKKPKVYPVSPRSSLNSLSDDDDWSDSGSGASTPVSSVGSDYGRGRNRARGHSRSRSRSRPEHFGVPRRHHSKPLDQRPVIVVPQKTTPPPPPPPPRSGGLADPYTLNPRRSDTRMDDFDEGPRGARGRETLAPRILQGVRRFSVEKPREDTFENDVEYLEDGLRRMKVDGSRFGVRGREYPREDLFNSRLDDRYDDDSRRPSPRRWDDKEVENYMRSRERRDGLDSGHPFAPRRGGTYQTSMYR